MALLSMRSWSCSSCNNVAKHAAMGARVEMQRFLSFGRVFPDASAQK
ncbi:UNVERIFIED_ORG: hypothetical protein J2X79_001908 [Arthrobacter globiformis]|nr:hypothetical protein [Arthrobacter globiformis]